MREAFDRLVPIELEDGRTIKLTRYALSIEHLLNLAAKRDLKAIEMVIKLRRELDATADPATSEPLADVDREFLLGIVDDLCPKKDEGQ